MAQINETVPSAQLERRAAEVIDPELVALPAPPRGKRLAAMTVMALVVVASMGFIASLRADIRYFFADSTAVDLGAAHAVSAASLVPDTYVRVQGAPMISGTVRYRRLVSGTTYAVFPLAGQRTIFVQVPLDDPERTRTFGRTEYSGRLVTFGALGSRFSTVRGFLHERMGMPVSSESFLLLADETPGSYAWALGLGALGIIFIVVNVALMLRWFRPIKA